MTISIILIVIAAIAKALQDHCMINSFPESWVWWNVSTGWRNKWKWGYRWESWSPIGPAFPGSTTFLVWLTDGWHFFQMVYLNCLMVGFWLLPKTWWVLLIAIIGFKMVFELMYRLIPKIIKL